MHLVYFNQVFYLIYYKSSGITSKHLAHALQFNPLMAKTLQMAGLILTILLII